MTKIEFTVGPETRTVHDAAVAAFDDALAAASGGQVMHMMDPTRINAFSCGGPPVWSVGVGMTDNADLHLTYGWSSAIDPAREGCDHELSIHVAGKRQMWPALVLRALARYMLGSRRELELGQYMPFPDALTRWFAPPHERDHYPPTTMNAALFAVDPVLPTISTAHGNVSVRRAFGLYPEEQLLMEIWSVPGFTEAIRAVNPGLVTDIDRPSYTTNPDVVAAVEAGSAKEGSALPYVAVPGVGWVHDEQGLHVRFPGGAHAARVHRMLGARLPFGRNLLVHDIDPANQLAVAFNPANDFGLNVDGPVLVVDMPPDHQLLQSFLQVLDGPELTWKFN